MKDEERAEEARRVGGVATATEGLAGRRGWQRGRRVREREGEKERGRRKAVRRRKEGFGRRPGSLGCLWSRHAACAVFSARLTLPACYGDGDAGRGVSAVDVEG